MLVKPSVICFGCLMVLLSAAPFGAAGQDNKVVEVAKPADIRTVRGFPAAEARPTAVEPNGTTALHLAVQTGDLDTVDRLIRAGADVGAATRYGVTPLALACANADVRLIERLLAAGANPNTATSTGDTVLMTAARTGSVAAVKVLLARGADANTRENRRGQTALMWAAAEDHAPVVQALIESGATVDARTPGGMTALLFAAREGRLTTLRTLLASGANPNDVVAPRTPVPGAGPGNGGTYVGTDGSSALALAIINQRFAAALLLLEHGANARVVDPRGSLLHALAWVRRPGADIGSTYVPPPTNDGESLAVVQALLARGADPNVRITWKEAPYDSDGAVRQPTNIMIGRNYLSFVGATPFYLAAKHSDVALMRLLVAHGADPLIPTAQNITPLMAAAGLGFWDGESPGPTTGVPESDTLEAVALCVELGNDVNAKTEFGDVDLVSDGVTLLEKLPLHITKDPDQEIGDMRWGGSTALHGAAFRGLVPVVRLLVGKGARVDVRNDLGWTPLTVAGGVFVHNNYHEPDARMIALLRELMQATPAVR